MLRYPLLIFLYLFSCSVLLGQDQQKKEQTKEKESKMSFSFFQYTWLPGINGTITEEAGSFEVNESFVEVFRNIGSTRAGGSLLSGSKNNWGGFTDNVFLNFDLGQQGVATDSLRLQQRVFYSLNGAFYRWVAWEDVRNMTSLNYRFTIYPFLGTRFSFVVNNLQASAINVSEDSRAWLEPVVGSMSTFRLINNGRLMVILMGNVGGFGAGSDFSWEAWGWLGMELGKNGSAHIGYRALGQNYSTDKSDDPFAYDVIIHGVWASIEFRFFY